MKRNGPPRTPTKLKLLRGTLRKCRTVPNEVQPKLGIPTCPEHLCDAAKVEFARVAKDLHVVGLLSPIDGALLAAYAEAYSDWADACRRCVGENGKDLKVIKTGENLKYDSDGKVIERSGGNFVENPYYSIKKRSAELMHKFALEFGLSPASRTRLPGKPQEAENEFEKFLRKTQNRKA